MNVRVGFEVPAGGQLDLTFARDALYGWLWARHTGGRFFVFSAEAGLPPDKSALAELSLLGLDWDGEADSSAKSSLDLHLPPVECPGASVTVGELARQGYSSLALVNCLARLGWSPRGKRALLTLEELAARFELGRVSHRPVRFDREQLDWFNRRWLGALPAGEVTALLVPYWQAAYGRAERADGTALSPDAWQQALALAIREELTLPMQAVEPARFAFADEWEMDSASQEALAQPYAVQVLEAFARELPSVAPLEFDPLDDFCRALRLRFKETLGIRSRDVMYVLRAALAGRQDGPCLVVICQLLGMERCIRRAQRAARGSL